MAGRPTKLTPEVQRKLCNALASGNYYEAACAHAGIDYVTFRRWMDRGEIEEEGEFCDFCNAVKAAEAAAELRVLALWQQEIPGNWQAARDFLARRYPDRWGPKERKDVNLTGGVVLEIVEEEVTERDSGPAKEEKDGPAAPDAEGVST